MIVSQGRMMDDQFEGLKLPQASFKRFQFEDGYAKVGLSARSSLCAECRALSATPRAVRALSAAKSVRRALL